MCVFPAPPARTVSLGGRAPGCPSMLPNIEVSPSVLVVSNFSYRRPEGPFKAPNLMWLRLDVSIAWQCPPATGFRPPNFFICIDCSANSTSSAFSASRPATPTKPFGAWPR